MRAAVLSHQYSVLGSAFSASARPRALIGLRELRPKRCRRSKGRGFVNPEANMLMLDHAFASGAVRVQFRVDSRNQRSQAAMTKLGAVREGMLRVTG